MGKRKRVLFATALALLVLFALHSSLQGQGTSAPPYPSDNERLGFDVTTHISAFDVSSLHAGWYMDWRATLSPLHPNGMTYVQTIRTCNPSHICTPPHYRPSGQALADIAKANPGSLWLIGNEPDCPYQDSVFPGKYAEIYHDAYMAIKESDPSAKVAIGGIVQATPLRMKWIDLVWNYYQQEYGQTMPVDVWNIHTFVLREVRKGYDCDGLGDWGAGIPPGLSDNCGMLSRTSDLDRMDILDEEVRRFRLWMKEHGQQDKPLIVSEYGILFNEEMGYGYDRVRDYMINTFNYFLNTKDKDIGYPADDYRLVQQWSWYSLDDDNFVYWGTYWGALFDPHTHQIKQLGVEFGKFAEALMPDLELTEARLTNVPAYGESSSVALLATVTNQGGPLYITSTMKLYGVGSTPLAKAVLPPLSRSASVTVPISASLRISGPITLSLTVTPSVPTEETDENNNKIFRHLGVNLTGEDLIPTLIGECPSITGITLTVHVRNRGDVTIPQGKVQFGLNTPGSNSLGYVTLPALAPGEEGTASLVWDNVPAGEHHVWAWVDPQNEVHEGIETDNILTSDVLVPTHRLFLPVSLELAPSRPGDSRQLYLPSIVH